MFQPQLRTDHRFGLGSSEELLACAGFTMCEQIVFKSSAVATQVPEPSSVLLGAALTARPPPGPSLDARIVEATRAGAAADVREDTLAAKRRRDDDVQVQEEGQATAKRRLPEVARERL